MNVDRPAQPIWVLSVFTGAAGLDEGVRLAFPSARTVCVVEREAYATAVLVSKMEAGALDPAPCFTDVSTFDGRPWRGRVDAVVAGFPCTDISNAGQRAGLDGDASGLWFELLRVIREVGPALVFLENVSALTVLGLGTVLGGLAESGLDAEWSCLRASEVGAPHERDRIFILGLANTDGRAVRLLAERDQRGQRGEPATERRDSESGQVGGGVALADSDSDRRQRQHRRGGGGLRGHGDAPLGDDVVRGGAAVVDAVRQGHPRAGGAAADEAQQPPAQRAGQPVPWPPGPEDSAGWRAYLERYPDLAPAIPQSPFRVRSDELAPGLDGAAGVVDPRRANRIDQLRLTGNGVVILQAAHAFRGLARRVMERR